MKRTPLARRTPLTARTPLRRARMAAEPRTLSVPSQIRPQRSTGPTAAVQRSVRARDGGVCVVCGQTGTPWDPLVIHHRRNRGQGGSTDPALNQPANLLLVHSSVNSAWEADAGRAAVARRAGWKVSRYVDAPETPVRYPDGWWLLDDDGGRRRP